MSSAEQMIDAYRRELAAAYELLATYGWVPFGTNVDMDIDLDFWPAALSEDPQFERVVER